MTSRREKSSKSDVLTKRHSVSGGEKVRSLDNAEINTFLKRLKGWEAVDARYPYPNMKSALAIHLQKTEPKDRLIKTYRFRDFESGLSFVSSIAAILKKEEHYPQILLSRTSVEVEIRTKRIASICEKDFILAAEFDKLFRLRKQTL